MPVPRERPDPNHPLRRAPARRATDRYMACGFFGIHLVATLLAIHVAFFDVPVQWHDRWWGVAVFVAGLLPLYAAWGIRRHARYAAARSRQQRFASQHRPD